MWHKTCARLTWAAVATALLLAAPLGGEEPAKADAKAEQARAEQLIRQMEAADAGARDAAQAALAELGESAVAPLRRALATARSQDFQTRARKVLNSLIGPEKSGLSLSLSVDRKTVKMGEELVFTLAFWNLNNKALNVPWGAQTGELRTNPCGFLCKVVLDGKDQRLSGSTWVGPAAPEGQAPKTMFQGLAPRSVLRVLVRCRYQDRITVLAEGEAKQAEQDVLAVGQYWALSIPKPGPYSFMAYLNAPPESARDPAGPGVDPKADFWTGEIHSNEVTVTFNEP